MENFTVRMHITPNEYAKFVLSRLYKRPVFYILPLIGILGIIQLALGHGAINFPATLCCIVLVLIGPLSVFISVKRFKSNRDFQNDIIYIFGVNSIVVEGTTFKTEFAWEHIVRIKEQGKFLVLYANKQVGYLVDKTSLTPDQVNIIKSKAK